MDMNIEEYIMSKDDLSGADIKAICTEAGLMALRLVKFNILKYYFGNDFCKQKNYGRKD